MQGRTLLAMVLLLALADLSWGQCRTLPRPAHASTITTLTAANSTPAIIGVPAFVPVLVPAFEFRYSPVVSSPLPAPAPSAVAIPSTPGDGWPVAVVPETHGARLNDPGRALALLRQHCGRCHTQPGKAGFSLFDSQGASIGLSGADRRRAYQQIASGAMPPSGRLTEQEVQILEQWSK